MTTRRLMEELRRRVQSGGRTEAPPPRQAGPVGRKRASRQLAGPVDKAPAPAIQNPDLLEQMKRSTPAKVGVGRAGLRYRTQTLLQFLADFSVAKAAVESQVPDGWAEQHGWLTLQTAAADVEQFLARPDLGRRLSEESAAIVRDRLARSPSPDVQIVVGDGLSANAVMQNAPLMVQVLVQELQGLGLTVGPVVFVRHCRARIMDIVGQMVGARVSVILVGERPGLGTGDGMSAYLVWDPGEERTDAEKQAVSNIHRRGLLPEDAGRHAARLIQAIIAQQTSGVGLDISGIEQPQSGSATGNDRARINQAHPEPLAGCGQSHGQQCAHSTNGLPGEICRRSDDRPCEVSRH
jgi:ethanolamine ammonia-lyase small subunit